MGERLDELCETGADEQEHGHPKKPKRIRRWALLVVVLSVAALAWSCVFHGGLTRKPASFLTTSDAVVAVRLGSGSSTAGDDFRYDDYDGWIVLLDADGRGQVAAVNNVLGGDVVWNERGVFYAASSHDFLTTQAGTQEIGRGDRSDERQRYALPDGALAVVSGEEFGYEVDTVHVDGRVASVENDKTGGSVGQCGARILAITDTKESRGISAAAFAAYAARSGGEASPTTLAAVVQLNDHDGEESPVLAVAPMIDGLNSLQHMFACEGDVITMPSELADEAAASRNGSTSERQRTLVLQRWDLSTGERSIIPVLDEAGNPLELNVELGIYEYEAIHVGSEYRFVSSDGDAFAVDLTSGQGRHLFSLNVSRREYLSVFQVTETGVYALKDRRVDRVVTLSYRPWEGGEWRDIFTTRDLAYFLKKGELTPTADIQSFALRPGWDGGAQ
ncbi:hypothetical protein [Actinomyces sp. HMSC035G02]|uniref:hypothetical protein n=1 Tax=Actinomyces sp. HMSC035G02 TaxID=1739406 RepID=UPI0008A9CDD4|nr:hypothetical protein [Actinomyces sp. HMSC035G02]OHR20974.1 hypothetical protein HMPREF2902_08885 [Actinomyces sp. HMSC035G02]